MLDILCALGSLALFVSLAFIAPRCDGARPPVSRKRKKKGGG